MSDVPTVRVVCLANSRKLHGRCIAGIEWDGQAAGRWIRPVSDREHEEVSEEERRFQNGADPKLLDIISIPFLRAKPNGHQVENVLLNPEYYWKLEGHLSVSELARFPIEAGHLWINGVHTNAGENDQIPVAQLTTIQSSLCLIKVESIKFDVCAPGAAFNNPKRRVRGHFKHNGEKYALWVTDPTIEREYLAFENGYYASGPAYITISLGEPFNAHSQKLIAAVIRIT
ncbi:MAG: dual OB domain-containing protein [Fimbriimonas sp.]